MAAWIWMVPFFLVSIKESLAELGKCSSAPIVAMSGLCMDTVFELKSCTGDRKWYQYTAADLNSISSEKERTLENYTSRYCYPNITATCNSFLPSTTVHHFHFRLFRFVRK